MMNFLKDLWGKAKSGVNQAESQVEQTSFSQKLASGGDIISALQKYGAFQIQSRALKGQADQERGLALSEVGNYNLSMSEAGDRYLRAISETEVAAAANGIDVASGSVVARKKDFAEEFSDYSRMASENAIGALYARRARMLRLRSDAARTKTLGWTNLVGDILNAAGKAAQAGGGS